jgi:hypothetical protein
MNDMTMQAIIWFAAGGALVFYLKRRRNRKTLP